jgi:hypothetical protein
MSNLLRREAADLQRRFADLLGVSSTARLWSRQRLQRLQLDHFVFGYMPKLSYIYNFIASISFVDLLYMLLSALPISPPRHARELGIANT